MKLLATFYTHSGALKFLKTLESMGINGRLMPVPRKVSSSCGVATCYSAPGVVAEMLIPEVDQIYQVLEGAYQTLYTNKQA